MVMVYLFYIETIQLDNHSWKKKPTQTSRHSQKSHSCN